MAVGTYMDAERKSMAVDEVHDRLHAGYVQRLANQTVANPVQRPARNTKTLWAVNFGLMGLVLLAGAASYVKHHPNLLSGVDEELAVGPTQQVGRHSDLAGDTKKGNKHMWHASKEMNPPLPPPTDHGGILPNIPIKYLPVVVVGFMLMVPILTISVLKGCWAMIDLFVPMQGAPQPDNYAARKHREDLCEDLEEGSPAAETS